MNPGEYRNLEAAEQRMWWFRGMRRILFQLLDPLAAQMPLARLLEIGCGTGAIARQISARYGWQVTPTDVSHHALHSAAALGSLRLLQCDTLRLPFPASTFDAVLSLDMLVHLEPGQESTAFAEFARVLKPGGLLILRAAAFHALRSRHSAYVGERQRFSRAQLTALAHRHGLHIHRATYANSLLLPIAFAKFRLWEPLTQAPPASAVSLGPPWLEALLYSALHAESAFLSTGRNLPLGQSILLLARKR